MNLPLDLRYNLRLLRKNPGFVAICVLMIGLGIGLSISLYSIGDNLGVKAMPFPDGDRFVKVFGFDKSTTSESSLPLDGYIFQNLQNSIHSFKTFGAQRSSLAIVSDGDVATRFELASLTSNLLLATGVVPLLGRNLSPADDIPGAQPVVLISSDLWQSYYVGREDIIGITSRINGSSYTVVGVMPEGFGYPQAHDLWLPLQLPSNLQPTDMPIAGTGVLADGVSFESAKAEIESLLSQLGQELPEFYGNYGARVVRCCGLINFDGRSPLDVIIPGLTLSLLLLISLNVANLILVRTNQRLHELGHL